MAVVAIVVVMVMMGRGRCGGGVGKQEMVWLVDGSGGGDDGHAS